ncbi:MAG: DUF167 domain-containing protein [Gemmatimonadetes bacterium]|nr:DUF167 domain-containing protein [Gemmatimonadota bacterium]
MVPRAAAARAPDDQRHRLLADARLVPPLDRAERVSEHPVSHFPVTERDGAVRFAVRVQPRSSRTGVEGVHGDALKVRVNAPPVDGAANEAVVEVLAEALGVPRRLIRIVTGESSRSKVVEIAGVGAAAIRDLAIRSSG